MRLKSFAYQKINTNRTVICEWCTLYGKSSESDEMIYAWKFIQEKLFLWRHVCIFQKKKVNLRSMQKVFERKSLKEDEIID